MEYFAGELAASAKAYKCDSSTGHQLGNENLEWKSAWINHIISANKSFKRRNDVHDDEALEKYDVCSFSER